MSDGIFQRRVVHALRYSWNGLCAAWRTEEAFRVEVFLFILLAPLGFYLGKDGISRVMLIGSLVLVLIVELLNSAIEATVDRVSTEWHDDSKRAKDMGSAAVLLAMLMVPVTWALVLLS